jgi:hypothetical protein
LRHAAFCEVRLGFAEAIELETVQASSDSRSMGTMIVCITFGMVAAGCGAALVAATLELRALRARLATLGDAEHEAARIRRTADVALADAEFEAACITNAARVKLLAAEDQAAQLLADARALSQFQDLESDEDTGVYRTVRPHALA